MVVDEIIGGLKWALQKGEPIKKAMMTFYNAGYDKEEIERAASILLREGDVKPISNEEPKVVKKEVSENDNNSKPVFGVAPSSSVVSNYLSSKESKRKGKFIVFILFVVLLALFALLAGIFFFRDKLVNLLNNFFQ